MITLPCFHLFPQVTVFLLVIPLCSIFITVICYCRFILFFLKSYKICLPLFCVCVTFTVLWSLLSMLGLLFLCHCDYPSPVAPRHHLSWLHFPFHACHSNLLSSQGFFRIFEFSDLHAFLLPMWHIYRLGYGREVVTHQVYHQPSGAPVDYFEYF